MSENDFLPIIHKKTTVTPASTLIQRVGVKTTLVLGVVTITIGVAATATFTVYSIGNQPMIKKEPDASQLAGKRQISEGERETIAAMASQSAKIQEAFKAKPVKDKEKSVKSKAETATPKPTPLKKAQVVDIKPAPEIKQTPVVVPNQVKPEIVEIEPPPVADPPVISKASTPLNYESKEEQVTEAIESAGYTPVTANQPRSEEKVKNVENKYPPYPLKAAQIDRLRTVMDVNAKTAKHRKLRLALSASQNIASRGSLNYVAQTKAVNTNCLTLVIDNKEFKISLDPKGHKNYEQAVDNTKAIHTNNALQNKPERIISQATSKQTKYRLKLVPIKANSQGKGIILNSTGTGYL